jgi:hypothetical protein
VGVDRMSTPGTAEEVPMRPQVHRITNCGSIAIVALIVCLPQARAQEPQISTERDRQQVSLTVYNDDLSLIRESRRVPVQDGVFQLRFEDVTSGIDPTTVHLSTSGGRLTILEQNYTFDLISRATLLEKYVGRRVGYRTADGTVGEATLLSTHQGPVYRLNDQIVFELPGPLVLDSIPGELSARPTLQWLLEGSRQGEQEVEVAYLSGGLSWRADYVLLLEEDEARADLTAWVTLDNRSGSAFRQAQLKLVAGQVNRVQERMGRMVRAGLEMKTMDAPAQFQEEALFEYHLYSLERRTDIDNNQKKQIKFFDASGVVLDKIYTLRGRSEYLNRGFRPTQGSERVAVALRFANSRENDLGVPIPAGILRVYKRDAQGAPQFLGENRVQHTPRDETIELEVGNAFDIVGEHRQVEYTRIGDRIFEAAFEVKLRNRKEEDVEVSVEEFFYGDWRILDSSLPHERRDATTAVFRVPVSAGGETVLTYRVRIER